MTSSCSLSSLPLVIEICLGILNVLNAVGSAGFSRVSLVVGSLPVLIVTILFVPLATTSSSLNSNLPEPVAHGVLRV